MLFLRSFCPLAAAALGAGNADLPARLGEGFLEARAEFGDLPPLVNRAAGNAGVLRHSQHRLVRGEQRDGAILVGFSETGTAGAQRRRRDCSRISRRIHGPFLPRGDAMIPGVGQPS
jgi:hypothetical protein